MPNHITVRINDPKIEATTIAPAECVSENGHQDNNDLEQSHLRKSSLPTNSERNASPIHLTKPNNETPSVTVTMDSKRASSSIDTSSGSGNYKDQDQDQDPQQTSSSNTGPRTVTATGLSSSGDDRSSGQNMLHSSTQSSFEANNHQHVQSHLQQQQDNHNHASRNHNPPSHNVASAHSSSMIAAEQQHESRSRRWQLQQMQRDTVESSNLPQHLTDSNHNATNTDNFGLPYPIDDQVNRAMTRSGHAVVVAQLPPPSKVNARGESDNNSGGVTGVPSSAASASILTSSGGSGSDENKGRKVNITSTNNDSTQLHRHRHLDHITQIVTGGLASISDVTNSSNGNSLHKSQPVNSKHNTTRPSSHAQPRESKAKDTCISWRNLHNMDQPFAPGPKTAFAENSSDSGYAASASSNERSRDDTSPSVSSSEDRPEIKHSSSHNKVKSNTKKTKEESSWSSDIPDFSSGQFGRRSSSSQDDDSLSSSDHDQEEEPPPVSTRLTPGVLATKAAARHLFSSKSNGNGSFSPHDLLQKMSSMNPNQRNVAKVAHHHDHHHHPYPQSYQPKAAKRAKHSTFSSVPNDSQKLGSWSFVERTLQGKMDLTEYTRKRTPVSHRRQLEDNFLSAMQRFQDGSSSPTLATKSMRLPHDSMNVGDFTISQSWQSGTSPSKSSNTTPIYDVGVDIMSTILSYLEPVEVNAFILMPLSKTWRQTYTIPDDLWRVLCLSKPFYAKSDLDDDTDSASLCRDLGSKYVMGKYRLLYSCFFVRCAAYLARIKDDIIHGRTPMDVNADTSNSVYEHPFTRNASLKEFFTRAREFRMKKRKRDDFDSSSDSSESSTNSSLSSENPSTTVDKLVSKKRKSKMKNVLTQRILGSALTSGIAGHSNLPWSCAIYSIINWMVAFVDVMGIQLMCLKTLPFLLEDERQRTCAQRAGLTDIVLRTMIIFPDNVELHTTAFHTLVLLARPLGGKEGMLFQSAMLTSSGIFDNNSDTGKSGIAIMLDSMKRFADNAEHQAMSCWSLVNIALVPSQKVVLVRLGGISAAVNAMLKHPRNIEVQFRALFALINLVIPSANLQDTLMGQVSIADQGDLGSNSSESEILDDSVENICNLVVIAMKNFCSSEAILNRACLVLHNLSLNQKYHHVLLWTPNCYQMIEWCLANYRQDTILQQSGGGTLQRLQLTLANNSELRARFVESLRAQQRNAVENALREDVFIQLQQQGGS